MPTNDANATGPLVWVLGARELNTLIEAMRASVEVVIDLETTGLDPWAVLNGNSNGGYPARIALASITVPQRNAFGTWDGTDPVTYVLPLSHPDSPWSGTWRRTLHKVILEGIVQPQRDVTNANVKFDANWVFAHTKIDLSSLIAWDTMISSLILDETETSKLKYRCAIEFDIEPWNDFDLSEPGAAERVPLFELGEYAARDTWWTWRLAQKHRAEMFIDGGGYPHPLFDLQPEAKEDYQTAKFAALVQWVTMPSVAALSRLEMNGIRLDVGWAKEALAEERAKKQGGLDRMHAMYPHVVHPTSGKELSRDDTSVAATSIYFKEWTKQAVAEDRLRIISMTKNGSPQWNKAVLKRNARDVRYADAAQTVLDTRSGQILSGFLVNWLSARRRDGKIHALYKVGGARTGRLSSSEPNMQQVTKKLRPAFIPDPGYVLADFDFSQLELRVAAFISRCQPMIDAFNEGQDLHRLLGSTIVSKRNRKDNAQFEELKAKRHDIIPLTDAEEAFLRAHEHLPEFVDPKEVTADDRQGAKSANFGLLYLQSAYGFKNYAETVYNVILTEEEAVEFYNAFFEQWVGMHEWHERVKKQVARDGYITSPIGRVRRLPNIFSGDEYLIAEAERQAVNSTVQGLGSDLMMLSLADSEGLLPGTKAVDDVKFVATVHDSVVAQLPIDGWQERAEDIAGRMANSVKWLEKMGVEFDVPIVAEYSVGTRWSWDDVSDPEGFAERHPELAAA